MSNTPHRYEHRPPSPPGHWPPHPPYHHHGHPPYHHHGGTGLKRGDHVHKPGWNFVSGLIGVFAAVVVAGFTAWVQQDIPNPLGALIASFGGMLAFIAVGGYYPTYDADETEMWVKMDPASQIVACIGALVLLAVGIGCAYWL